MDRPAQRSIGLRACLLATAVLGLLLAGATSAGQPEGNQECKLWDEHSAAARDAEQRKDWQAALGHYRQALEVAETLEAHDPRRLETLEALGEIYYWHLHQPAEALPYLERAAAFREATGTFSGKEAWNTLWALSSTYQSLQAWDKAVWAKTLELRSSEARWGKDSPRLASDLTHLAWLVDQARPGDPKAERYILRAIHLADTPERRRDAYASAGRYYLDRGRYDEAIDHLAEAIALHEAASVPNLERLYSLYGAAGEAYSGAGQPELAEKALTTAVTLQEERFGPSHPYLVRPLYDLGHLLLAQGRPEAALPHLERAVALADASWGRSSAGYVRDALAQAYQALDRPVPKRAKVSAGEEDDCSCGSDLPPEIEALREKGEIKQAEELARKRVRSTAAEHGAVSREAAGAWGTLGLLLWSTDPAGAADAYEEKLEILDHLDGVSSSEIARTADRAAYLASSLQQYERCEGLRLRQVKALRAGTASASLAEAVGRLGQARMWLERYAEAAEDYRRAAELWGAIAGEGSAKALEARQWMAWSLIRDNRFNEAEQVLVADLARLENARSQEEQRALEQVLLALTRVFEATGRDGEAQAMRERRRALMAER